MPHFCMKRTLSAMPPTLAGVTRFTNDEASCTCTFATIGRLPMTLPDVLIAPATYEASEIRTQATSHAQSAD